jgi:hypothetical protein
MQASKREQYNKMCRKKCPDPGPSNWREAYSEEQQHVFDTGQEELGEA